MKAIYQYKSFGLSLKDIDSKEGIVSGYFSAFNVKDSDGDIIRPGAFKKTISENKERIKHFLNHDIRKSIGKIVQLSEDNFGLAYASKIGSHNDGQDFLKMAESGLITEHSIGYRTIHEQKEADANIITELKLWEGSSLTAWGANQYTPLTGIKALDENVIEQKIKALEKFVKNSTATDETIELLMIEIKQLQQLVIDIQTDNLKKTTQPVLETTVPEASDQGLVKAISSIRELFKT